MRLIYKHRRGHFGLYLATFVAIATIIFLGDKVLKNWLPAEEMVIHSAAAILIDASSGKVIYQKNADEAHPPASMSKMMTELIVLEGVLEGRLSWNDRVSASHYAAHIPGTRMGLSQGDQLTVRELFDSMTIYSANDAAVALAEHIGGSEKAFVHLMNEKAARIGLSIKSVFGNASGLSKEDIASYHESAHEQDTMMTAKDTAMLAGYLMGKFPEVLEVTSRGSVRVSTNKKSLSATNLMLENKPYEYVGNDGLKTGYTPNAGYCFTGTAKRDGKRLISVVMGADSKDTRFTETKKLYEMGFSQ
ncbi:D-alanyl-D-alanine carboxypeptidase family protein [Paenibacillus sp. L3-i20]|uniref:D-alanyl-D-alanine carboxypeptidase family protein n=1 Tax=Paenibacillus sp. L3-i20 TaxID=2905833 RepID=UPI001EE0FB3E|nr:D-alanyl-D-alanine carboxypeptidase family protein [Paenibacillus sp. L3-i20]